MSRLPVLSARAIVAKLVRAGFQFKGAHGSHQIYHHPKTGRFTSVPIHGGNDIGRTLLKKIITQTGLSVDEFLSL